MLFLRTSESIQLRDGSHLVLLKHLNTQFEKMIRPILIQFFYDDWDDYPLEVLKQITSLIELVETLQTIVSTSYEHTELVDKLMCAIQGLLPRANQFIGLTTVTYPITREESRPSHSDSERKHHPVECFLDIYNKCEHLHDKVINQLTGGTEHVASSELIKQFTVECKNLIDEMASIKTDTLTPRLLYDATLETTAYLNECALFKAMCQSSLEICMGKIGLLSRTNALDGFSLSMEHFTKAIDELPKIQHPVFCIALYCKIISSLNQLPTSNALLMKIAECFSDIESLLNNSTLGIYLVLPSNLSDQLSKAIQETKNVYQIDETSHIDNLSEAKIYRLPLILITLETRCISEKYSERALKLTKPEPVECDEIYYQTQKNLQLTIPSVFFSRAFINNEKIVENLTHFNQDMNHLLSFILKTTHAMVSNKEESGSNIAAELGERVHHTLTYASHYFTSLLDIINLEKINQIQLDASVKEINLLEKSYHDIFQSSTGKALIETLNNQPDIELCFWYIKQIPEQLRSLQHIHQLRQWCGTTSATLESNNSKKMSLNALRKAKLGLSSCIDIVEKVTIQQKRYFLLAYACAKDWIDNLLRELTLQYQSPAFSQYWPEVKVEVLSSIEEIHRLHQRFTHIATQNTDNLSDNRQHDSSHYTNEIRSFIEAFDSPINVYPQDLHWVIDDENIKKIASYDKEFYHEIIEMNNFNKQLKKLEELLKSNHSSIKTRRVCQNKFKKIEEDLQAFHVKIINTGSEQRVSSRFYLFIYKGSKQPISFKDMRNSWLNLLMLRLAMCDFKLNRMVKNDCITAVTMIIAGINKASPVFDDMIDKLKMELLLKLPRNILSNEHYTRDLFHYFKQITYKIMEKEAKSYELGDQAALQEYTRLIEQMTICLNQDKFQKIGTSSTESLQQFKKYVASCQRHLSEAIADKKKVVKSKKEIDKKRIIENEKVLESKKCEEIKDVTVIESKETSEKNTVTDEVDKKLPECSYKKCQNRLGNETSSPTLKKSPTKPNKLKKSSNQNERVITSEDYTYASDEEPDLRPFIEVKNRRKKKQGNQDKSNMNRNQLFHGSASEDEMKPQVSTTKEPNQPIYAEILQRNIEDVTGAAVEYSPT